MKKLKAEEIDWGLKPLHNKMLEIIQYIHNFCTNNDIEYCLAYGSVLGAVRHKGFIPWDDDMDIHMTCEGYKKFRTLFKEKGDHDRFYLQEFGAIDGMCALPKLRMNSTAFIEPLSAGLDMHHGIYIDIFVLHNVPDGWLKKRIMLGSAQYIALKKLADVHYNRRRIYIPILALFRRLPKKMQRYALCEFYKYDALDYDAKEYFAAEYRASQAFFRKGVLFPAKLKEFCGTELYVPANTEEYLRQLYGNYMQLPDIDSIEWAQHAKQWSVTEDFRKFAKNIKNFSDE